MPPVVPRVLRLGEQSSSLFLLVDAGTASIFLWLLRTAVRKRDCEGVFSSLEWRGVIPMAKESSCSASPIDFIVSRLLGGTISRGAKLWLSLILCTACGSGGSRYSFTPSESLVMG